jgi:Family of unknown function (DUF6515)
VYNNIQLRYYQGVYYQPVNGGYQVIPPPLNVTIQFLPQGYTTLTIGGTVYYYFGGVFYLFTQNGFMVVRAPAGAIVPNLPEGCEQVQAGNTLFLKYNSAYYQPIVYNGQNVYEVVEME